MALARRPDLEQARLRRTVAGEGMRNAEAARGARTSLSASSFAQTPVADPEGLIDKFDPIYGYAMTLSVRFNLFDAGAASAAVQEAQESVHQADIRLAETEADLRLQVERAFHLLRSSTASIETARMGLEAARQGLKSARLRRDANLSTQTELIEAENDLQRAESNLARAVIDSNRAISALESLTLAGTPPPESLLPGE